MIQGQVFKRQPLPLNDVLDLLPEVPGPEMSVGSTRHARDPERIRRLFARDHDVRTTSMLQTLVAIVS